MKKIANFFIWLFTGKKPAEPKPVFIYPDYKPTKYDFDIADSLNAYRKRQNLPHLNFGLNKKLCDIAFAHCKYMAFCNKPSHVGFQQRANEFPNHTLGEIVAYNFQTPASTVQGWLASPDHKAVIDGRDYDEIGIARVVSDGGKNYVTVLFLTN